MGDDELTSYETGTNKHYTFRPLHGKALRFKIKAAHDCLLSFSSVDEDTSDMFEVFIGGWKGSASAIRFKKEEDLVKENTPGILNDHEYREFWVTFDDDHVRVGHGGDWTPFMEAELPDPIEVNFHGYSTGWGASGSWQFFNERVLETENNAHYSSHEPIYGTSFTFSVACDNDAHIALTSVPEDADEVCEVYIGGWKNKKSAIRLNKDAGQTVAIEVTPNIVSSDEEKIFYITFKDGHIRVGHHDRPPFMEYQFPHPFEVTYVSYCTGWGSPGKWKLDV